MVRISSILSEAASAELHRIEPFPRLGRKYYHSHSSLFPGFLISIPSAFLPPVSSVCLSTALLLRDVVGVWYLDTEAAVINQPGPCRISALDFSPLLSKLPLNSVEHHTGLSRAQLCSEHFCAFFDWKWTLISWVQDRCHCSYSAWLFALSTMLVCLQFSVHPNPGLFLCNHQRNYSTRMKLSLQIPSLHGAPIICASHCMM